MVTRQPGGGRMPGVPAHEDENTEDRTGEGLCGDVAAHVLGVLDPAQQKIFDAHLTGCESCQRDAADFGMFAPVLRQCVSPATGSDISPPAVRREPCRFTRSLLLVATGFVVALAAVLSVVESFASDVDAPVELGTLLRAQGVSASVEFPLFRHV